MLPILPLLLYVLPLGTLGTMALYWPKRGRLLWVLAALGLCAAQWALVYLQAATVFWTVD